MSRIPHGQLPAKRPTLPCCKCKQPHPEDPTTRRMAEHAHQGRRCLGSDIPFAKHTEEPMGKLLPFVRPIAPMPNRARAIAIARRHVPPSVIDRLLAEPWQHDLDEWFWLVRLAIFDNEARLEADVAHLRRPKPRTVRERRAGA